MPLPTFLIVGAAKCGTTSVFDYLGQHPDVYVPPCKEPQYFSRGPYPNLAANDREYEALFAGAKREKAIGEGSVSYLCDEQAPARIKALLPDVKIVILLRDPVQRAYALWWHMYQLGFETLPFAEALAKEDERRNSARFRETAKHYHGFFHYFHSGLYSRQVETYFTLFERRNVHVHIFEEAMKNLPELCRELFTFIGVDADFAPNFAVQNAAHAPKSRSLQRFLTTPPTCLLKAYALLPPGVQRFAYNRLKKLYWSNMEDRRRPPLAPALAAELHKKFAPDVDRLESLFGRELASLWRCGGDYRRTITPGTPES